MVRSASTSIGVFLLASCLLLLAHLAAPASASSHENPDGTFTHSLHFKIQYVNITRLCNGTKQIYTVNGLFPGPTVYVRTGDYVNIKVSNHIDENVTIHWHGVRQLLTVWADGPAYITQCPLQPNEHYNHNFTVIREQGTLFWHAHIGWLRGTLYGAFVIMPPKGQPYPFPIQPKAEFPLIIGEWWNMQLDDVEKFGLESGVGYNVSNATTINGQPGLLYPCSQEDATVINVKKGETYLLRIINAAMNFQMFFQVANHSLTIVETDASLSKPYTTEILVLAPGQTADVLLTADQNVDTYVFGAATFSPPNPIYVPYPMTMTTGILAYEGAPNKTAEELELELPTFPAFNDTSYAMSYWNQLKSLNSVDHPSNVPQTVDKSFLFTVGYSLIECKVGEVCKGPEGQQVGTNINNMTFELPSISILEAYYARIHANDSLAGILDITQVQADDTFQEDFPTMPLFQYNYTAGNLTSFFAESGTKVAVVDFNATVQLVLQNTNTLFFESHPIHLHGYNFFVVGLGLGTFVEKTDSPNFNLVDPPLMNTIAVPPGGWAAIRFTADNPGVWLMHCHFEMHTSWGMMTAIIVKDGVGPSQTVPPPPKDYPKC